MRCPQLPSDLPGVRVSLWKSATAIGLVSQIALGPGTVSRRELQHCLACHSDRGLGHSHDQTVRPNGRIGVHAGRP